MFGYVIADASNLTEAQLALMDEWEQWNKRLEELRNGE